MLEKTGLRTISLTIPWSQPNLLNFLRRSHGRPRFFWENRRDAISIAGFGTAAVFEASGDQRFAKINRQIEKFWAGFTHLVESPAPAELPQPCVFGGFSFEPHDSSENPRIWTGFRDARFFVPKYQLLRYKDRSWLTVTADAVEGREFAPQDALWDMPAMKDVPPASSQLKSGKPISLMRKDEWVNLVNRAKDKIHSGRLQKVVTARALEFDHSTDPISALGKLSGRYPDCYRFLFEPEPGHAFFGASPELLGTVIGGWLDTMALAGSAPRGISLDEDENLGKGLLASQKDRNEHSFVVQDICNSLSGLLPEIQVGDTGLLKLSNIQHLHTPISAGPMNGLNMLEVIDALHPTPAVGGLPRAQAHQFICEHEPVSRGWYASPIGWLGSDGGGTFAVALRSAVTDSRSTRLYAGAGLVADSEPEKEWLETDMKFAPMLEAIR